MNITVTSANQSEYLLLESKGMAVSKEDLIKHCELVFKEILKHNCDKILINEPHTDFSLELTDYFDLVRNYVSTLPPETRKLKIAAVVAPQYREVAETWESLCVSRGFTYFAFICFDKAKEWLLTEEEE